MPEHFWDRIRRFWRQWWCGLHGHGGWSHVDCNDPRNCGCDGWWICKRCGKLEDFSV